MPVIGGLNLLMSGVASPPLFNPTALPGVVGVYDISGLSSLFQERTGAGATTPATLNGPVGTVLDLSPAGNHLTAPTDAARPILRQTLAGYYFLEHDGVDDTLASAPLASLPAPLYLAFAFQKRAQVSSFLPGLYLDGANYAGPLNVATNSRLQPRVRFTSAGGPRTLTSPSNSAPVDTPLVYDQNITDMSFDYALNGSTTAESSPFAATLSNDFDGCYITTTQTFDSLDFYGGVFRAGTPNAGSERADIQAWLSDLVGTTLS